MCVSRLRRHAARRTIEGEGPDRRGLWEGMGGPEDRGLLALEDLARGLHLRRRDAWNTPQGQLLLAP